MAIFKSDKYELIWFDDTIKAHYVKHLSHKIISKFGKQRFDTYEQTNEILFFFLHGLMDQMKCTLMDETSLAIYQYVQILHDQSNEIFENNNLSEHFTQVTEQEFSIYRRVLRFILEQACHLTLVFKEPLDDAKVRAKVWLEELIHIGFKIYTYSNLISSQQLIEDSVEIYFNEDDLYIIDYKHHYNALTDVINDEMESHLKEGVKVDNVYSDFAAALTKCFGASYGDIVREVHSLHECFKTKSEPYPCAMAFDLHSFVDNLASNSGISYSSAKLLTSGLILSSETKCSFEDGIYKPQSIKRHIYRPFLEWNILRDGKVNKRIIVGKSSLRISLHLIATNSIGWRKYPEEWKSKCFDDFVQEKVESNDKVLEDRLEVLMKEHDVIYDRNVTHLKKENNQNTDIDNEECGEIDFLLVSRKEIYIADSKFLLARYDFNNWRNDFSAFETRKKSYNKTIERKVDYLKLRKDQLEEHFLVLTGKKFDFTSYEIFPMFLINTPTFYMYNSKHLILTIRDFIRFLSGDVIYPSYNIVNEDSGDSQIVSHPYFKKPNYTVFEEE